MQKWTMGLAIATSLAIGSSAQAVVISNATTATTVFDSIGFENDTPGTDASTASPGFWSNTGLPVDVVVTGGSPGAFTGVNYMSTIRTFASAGNVRAFLTIPETTSGDTIHMEWAMYVDNSVALNDGGVFIANDAGANIGQLRFGGNGSGTIQDSWSGIITSNAYTPDTWQIWELDHTIGGTSSTLTVDGGTPITLITPGNAPSSGIGHLSFFHNGNDTAFYLDRSVVPEPTTMALLGLGGLMFLRRRTS